MVAGVLFDRSDERFDLHSARYEHVAIFRRNMGVHFRARNRDRSGKYPAVRLVVFRFRSQYRGIVARI